MILYILVLVLILLLLKKKKRKKKTGEIHMKFIILTILKCPVQYVKYIHVVAKSSTP